MGARDGRSAPPGSPRNPLLVSAFVPPRRALKPDVVQLPLTPGLPLLPCVFWTGRAFPCYRADVLSDKEAVRRCAAHWGKPSTTPGDRDTRFTEQSSWVWTESLANCLELSLSPSPSVNREVTRTNGKTGFQQNKSTWG